MATTQSGMDSRNKARGQAQGGTEDSVYPLWGLNDLPQSAEIYDKSGKKPYNPSTGELLYTPNDKGQTVGGFMAQGQDAGVDGIETFSGPQTQSGDGGFWKSAGGEVAKQAGPAAASYFEAREQEHLGEYYNDFEYWENQGKYWFNPDSPDFEAGVDEWLGGMPEQTDALMDSTLTGGAQTRNPVLMDVFMVDPAATVSRILGKEENIPAHEYAYHKGGQGALGGLASGGYIGAIVGGAVGYITGFLGYKDAAKKDREKAKEKRKQVEKEYELWLDQRNKAIEKHNEKVKSYQLRASSAQAKKSLDEAKVVQQRGAQQRKEALTALISASMKQPASNLQRRKQ